MSEDRAALFRKRALEAETKAFNAASEESRRAWQIVARDWTSMAEKEAARAAADLEIERLIGALVKKPQQV
jgi:hypothetical protein